MKFLASKKLSDNPTLRGVIFWMLLLFIIAMGLNLSAKGIEFGITPDAWMSVIMGNPEEFTDPMLWSDLLLGVHTDLFGLIIILILIASLYVRMSRATPVKVTILGILLVSLLLYPLGLLSSSLLGKPAIMIGLGSFTLYHITVMIVSIDLLIALVRKQF